MIFSPLFLYTPCARGT